MDAARVRDLVVWFLVGALFLFFSFGSYIRYLVHQHIHNSAIAPPIDDGTKIPNRILIAITSAPGAPTSTIVLERLLQWCIVALAVFLAAAILLGLVRLSPLMMAGAFIGGIVGLFLLAGVSWTGVGLVAIWHVFVGVASAVGAFLHAIGPYVGFVILAGFGLLLACVLVYLLVVALMALGDVFVSRPGATIAALLALSIVGFAGYSQRGPLDRFYVHVLKPGLDALHSVLSAVDLAVGLVVSIVILVVVAILLIGGAFALVAGLGVLVRDQFASAWDIGTGHRGMLLGSFGIGLSIALILLECSGSPTLRAAVHHSWVTTVPVSQVAAMDPEKLFRKTLPAPIRSDTRHLRSAGAPIFDAGLLLAILGVAYLGFIRGLSSREDLWKERFVRKDVLILLAVIPFILLAVVGGMLPSDNS